MGSCGKVGKRGIDAAPSYVLDHLPVTRGMPDRSQRWPRCAARHPEAAPQRQQQALALLQLPDIHCAAFAEARPLGERIAMQHLHYLDGSEDDEEIAFWLTTGDPNDPGHQTVNECIFLIVAGHPPLSYATHTAR